MTHLFRRLFSYLQDRKEFQSLKTRNREQFIHCQRKQIRGVQVEHKLRAGGSTTAVNRMFPLAAAGTTLDLDFSTRVCGK